MLRGLEEGWWYQGVLLGFWGAESDGVCAILGDVQDPRRTRCGEEPKFGLGCAEFNAPSGLLVEMLTRQLGVLLLELKEKVWVTQLNWNSLTFRWCLKAPNCLSNKDRVKQRGAYGQFPRSPLI